MEVRFQVDQEQLRVLREGGGNNPRADDLLLLTRRPWKDTSALKSNQPVTHALATVTRLEAINGAMVLTLLLNLRVGAETPGATPCRPSQVLRHLLPRSTWSGLRVTSLVPQMRELAALSAVHTLDGNLQGVILDPRTAAGALPPPPPLSAVPLPRRLKEKLQEDYNPSQLLAIAAAVCGPARVTLVQGPPGTGKTAAIVGIISALSACARGEEGGAAGRGRSGGGSGAAGLREGGGEKEAQGDRGEREVTWEEQVAAMEGGEAPAARVLVCAQSNAAIDELLLRLASRGLYGRDGRRRAAAVVRAGVATPGGKSALFHIDEWAARRQRRAAENDDKDAAAAGLEAIRCEAHPIPIASSLLSLEWPLCSPSSLFTSVFPVPLRSSVPPPPPSIVLRISLPPALSCPCPPAFLPILVPPIIAFPPLPVSSLGGLVIPVAFPS